MSDINCAKCGEPWEAWGIMESENSDSGDMYQWEAKLFRAGSGCPACRGETPEWADAAELLEEHVRQRIFNAPFDDDAYPAGLLEETTPPWEEPNV